MQKMYFISGVSGVGKTVVARRLKSLLSNGYEVHDFDERGVPDNAGHKWRLDETRNWITLGQEKVQENITLVICGFLNPDEIDKLLKDLPAMNVQTILLDGDPSIIEQRLRKRNEDTTARVDLERAAGRSADAFIENNTRFVPVLREICHRHNCPIIDTSHLDPETVAERVAGLIEQ
ncbi:AAA family ATPase [Candidatus Uhrbacteria bacterium]|nr:AAA family ATPase [Candidatus Uhrbacteria bacterium]